MTAGSATPTAAYIPRMSPRRARLPLPLVAAASAAFLVACIDKDTTTKAVRGLIEPPTPESLPRMLNAEPPFRYPASLYDRKVQGNVTLRIFIDSTGRVWPESTFVAESSGYPALDSAAMLGSDALRFRPALAKDGTTMSVRVAFPVFFRHPEAQALPGDTVLKQGGTGD